MASRHPFIHRQVAHGEEDTVKRDAVGSGGQATHRPRHKGEIGRQAKTLGKIVSLDACFGGQRIRKCRFGQGVTSETTTIDVRHA